MLEKLFRSRLPTYVVLPALLLVAAGVVLVTIQLRPQSLSYEFVLPKDQFSQVPGFTVGAWPALGNADFFAQVKQKFIDQKASFIEADLSTMRLRVWQGGSVAKEAPILTKGRPGSWWETPAGLYKVELKERNHFSGFGHVYQPWSMVFQGNFFIHGWPYYPDGTPVASTYSGGCIRLATADAEAVYNLATVGMPVLVYEKDFGTDDFHYALKGPDVSGQEYLAADLHDTYVFASASSSVQVPIASLTKLVTALVATEYINLDRDITIQPGMLATTSIPRLAAGQKISAYQLLYPLLLESSNEAAFAFSGFLGREQFVALMNQKAAALGMTHTHFVDPAGISAGNVSTAEDLFNLARYLYNNRSFILKISAGHVTESAYGPTEFRDLQNFNVFAADPEFVGGKVGELGTSTESILSIFAHPFDGQERPFVVVVLGSSDNAADARSILEYIRVNYGG